MRERSAESELDAGSEAVASPESATSTGSDATARAARPESITLRLPTVDDTEAFGRRLASLLGAGDVVVLTGPLGAGKTTLTRGLGEALGVRGPIQSPTFVVARTHPSLVSGPALIHVDAYRLGGADELDDLDLDLAASVTVVEWGRDVVASIADSWLDVELARPRADADADVDGETDADADEDEPRTVTVRAVGERWRTRFASGLLARLEGGLPLASDHPDSPATAYDHRHAARN